MPTREIPALRSIPACEENGTNQASSTRGGGAISASWIAPVGSLTRLLSKLPSG